MSSLNFDAFRRTTLVCEPFEHLIVPGFITPEAVRRVVDEFPQITQGGSFPLASLEYGAGFGAFCRELQGAEMRAAFESKFGVDLSERPTTLTVRGRCRMKDGRVHVDSKSKLITVLLYVNDTWGSNGGRLRILGSSDINDVAYEAPPEQGTLIAFRNGPNAWHGHLPFDGVRRVMQLNWVTDESAVRRSERRHGLSAVFKRFRPFKKVA